MGKIVAEMHGVHDPDLNVFMLDLGFSRFDPFRGFEGDGNLRSFFREGFKDKPPSHKRRDQGNQPNQGGARSLFNPGCRRCRCGVRIRMMMFHVDLSAESRRF